MCLQIRSKQRRWIRKKGQKRRRIRDTNVTKVERERKSVDNGCKRTRRTQARESHALCFFVNNANMRREGVLCQCRVVERLVAPLNIRVARFFNRLAFFLTLTLSLRKLRLKRIRKYFIRFYFVFFVGDSVLLNPLICFNVSTGDSLIDFLGWSLSVVYPILFISMVYFFLFFN